MNSNIRVSRLCAAVSGNLEVIFFQKKTCFIYFDRGCTPGYLPPNIWGGSGFTGIGPPLSRLNVLRDSMEQGEIIPCTLAFGNFCLGISKPMPPYNDYNIMQGRPFKWMKCDWIFIKVFESLLTVQPWLPWNFQIFQSTRPGFLMALKPTTISETCHKRWWLHVTSQLFSIAVIHKRILVEGFLDEFGKC